MNGAEYTRLLQLIANIHAEILLARSEAETCNTRLDGVEKGLDNLEKKADGTLEAIAAGKAGVRVIAWIGGIMIGLGALATSILTLKGGTNGP
jgi:hypothetical protein